MFPEANIPDFLLALFSTKVPGRSEGAKALELTQCFNFDNDISKQCDLESNAQSSKSGLKNVIICINHMVKHPVISENTYSSLCTRS